MQQLTISNDWLPIDEWIAEAIDKSVSISQIESDLVDCLLFWSTNHSIKGTSSRDSLAKSIEAVRILASLGIDYPLDDAQEKGMAPHRLRDFFKAPFANLKKLKSALSIETLIGVRTAIGVEKGIENFKILSAYWQSESKERVDKRLYAMVCKNYETAVAEAIYEKELRSIFDRLVRITRFPSQIDTIYNVDEKIRTIIAIHLNKIKRPSLRRASANSVDSSFKEFEPLTKEELKKIQKNASLTGSRKIKVDSECNDLINKLDVDDDLWQKIFSGYRDSWTDYISSLLPKPLEDVKGGAERKEGKKESNPLGFFRSHFIIDDEIYAQEIAKFNERSDMMKELEQIFIEPEVKYSRKELNSRRGSMPIKELDSMLRRAEKERFISSSVDAGKKLYELKSSESLGSVPAL